jgi:coenzyme F420-reducing hydrogenase delta subunit
MEFTGIETDRITFSWVSAAEGNRWADLVNMVTEKIYGLGPYNNYKKMLNTRLEEEV